MSGACCWEWSRDACFNREAWGATWMATRSRDFEANADGETGRDDHGGERDRSSLSRHRWGDGP